MKRLVLPLAVALATPLLAQVEHNGHFHAALDLLPEDRVVITGNTFAERMARYGYLEQFLQLSHPEFGLTFRNLGWSGDEVDLMPRPANWGSFDEHLSWQGATVVLLCFGMNESFAGPDGVEAWRTRVAAFFDRLQGLRTATGEPLRLAAVSPIAHEDLGQPGLPTGAAIRDRNRDLALYTDVMHELADERSIPFVDLYTRHFVWMRMPGAPRLTSNGIHLNEFGYWVTTRWIVEDIGWMPREVEPKLTIGTVRTMRGQADDPTQSRLERFRSQILDKDHHFFLSWRPLNPYYIWGGRSWCWEKDEPMKELARIEAEVARRDRQIQFQAQRSAAASHEIWGQAPASFRLDAPELWETPRSYREETAEGEAPPVGAGVFRNGALPR